MHPGRDAAPVSVRRKEVRGRVRRRPPDWGEGRLVRSQPMWYECGHVRPVRPGWISGGTVHASTESSASGCRIRGGNRIVTAEHRPAGHRRLSGNACIVVFLIALPDAASAVESSGEF